MNEKQEILENKTKNLEVLQDEVKNASKQLDERKFFLELLQEEWAAKQLSHKASQENFEPISVTWKFENHPDYVDALKRINVVKYKKSEYDYNNQKEKLQDDLNVLTEQIESAQEEISKVILEIKDLQDETGDQ